MDTFNIKALRTALGLTQEHLAQLIGVSWTSISNWESGRAKPSPLASARLEPLQHKFERQKKHRAEIDKILKGLNETARILEKDPAGDAVINVTDPYASIGRRRK